ncbi:hypothetical protein [Magnetovibrio sp.]|uniref:hypothetical protein n=1 Tax=Magnetovibrio sp. TaxID=2024836 RepID=UPI002F95750F
MAKDTKEPDDAGPAEEPFDNRPSDLDEMTHQELRLMHEEASTAVLFAKNIQWRSVGASLLVFGACIAIAVSIPADKTFANLLSALTILLTCGVIFVLLMYQFWQFNEFARIDKIEQQFSTLYRKIRNAKSRREGNAHRYTLLMFMMAVVVLGAVVANIAIKQSVLMKKPSYSRSYSGN